MVQATSLYSKATTKPTDLGTVQWGTAVPACRFSRLVRQPKPVQERRRRCNQSVSRVGHATVKNKPSAKKEPWLLVASLSLHSSIAKQIMRLYQVRMQIKEGFRDSENRYGWWSVAQANRIGQ